MTFGEVIVKHRKLQGLKQKELAEKLGHNNSTQIYRWEKGENIPTFDGGLQVCAILGITDPLCEFGFTEPELNEKGQALLSEFKNVLVSSGAYEPVAIIKTRTIPLYEVRASAGPGVPIDTWVPYNEIEVDASVLAAADCAILISGQSMEPRIVDGQTVYVHRQETLQPGQVGIFFLDGVSLCKKLHQDNGVVELHSYNPEYEPIRIGEQDDLRVFGHVLA